MAVLLYQLQQDGLFRGNLMKLYIVAYATYRFFSEFLRDERPLWLDLTGYQWASLVLIAWFAALWWYDAKQMALADKAATTPHAED